MEFKKEFDVMNNFGFVGPQEETRTVSVIETAASSLAQTAQQQELVRRINILGSLAKQSDPSFIVKFHEFFPEFSFQLNSVANPRLTSIEMEICAYTKINLSTKEIAIYRNDSVRSVENRKYRIRKKLKLKPEDDFILWISKIKLG